jgi:16S rRNA processing protein RimM
MRCETQWRPWTVEAGRLQGKGLVVKLRGCDDRAEAAKLLGADIAVWRNQLADDLAPGQYYWADLEGLRVVTQSGVELGRLDHLFATGANDVMVVRGERERLVPYLPEQVVKEVDLRTGVMRVEWDPEF